MPDDVAQPHDHLFRAVFCEPAEAAGLLRAHLPPAVRRRFGLVDAHRP